MKPVRLIIAFIFIIQFSGCGAQTTENMPVATGSNSDKIEAYYFHFTARCNTCRTIEAEAKKNLELLYPEKFRQGLITFQSLNLEEESVKPVARKLGISGQTLLLVKGDQKVNLTNEGFMYAVVKPEKFREIINEKVDGLMIR